MKQDLTDMETRLLRIEQASDLLEECRLGMKNATLVDDIMNYFLGYMDWLTELHRLLYANN